MNVERISDVERTRAILALVPFVQRMRDCGQTIAVLPGVLEFDGLPTKVCITIGLDECQQQTYEFGLRMIQAIQSLPPPELPKN